MKHLDGRVAVITGAGRGIGREHALLFAREGAAVVVNDLAEADGNSAADDVVAEIHAEGGHAVASHHDITDTDSAAAMIATAVEQFGRLDVLVNNAGILRDRMLVNMTDEEWNDVVRVHLRGHFLPMRAAARVWRDASKRGEAVSASVINTTSTSGLMSNVGQSNYGAAKSGIASMTEIAAKELQRYGVRCNAIAPAARTRLTLGAPGGDQRYAAERERATSDWLASDPANIAPFVAYLASERCTITGKVFFVYANAVHLFQPWTIIDSIRTEERWDLDELEAAAAHWADVQFDYSLPMD
ncbi:MAG: SDR family oxidoreductase [Actinobacteria bacterium]|nr:SDR family oxidoreductase [Actinomycetota bacterium]